MINFLILLKPLISLGLKALLILRFFANFKGLSDSRLNFFEILLT
jgi:hypothetical protein